MDKNNQHEHATGAEELSGRAGSIGSGSIGTGSGGTGSSIPDPMTPDGRDILISRVIDAEASAEDWSAFRTLAESDPTVWRELGDAQRQHEVLGEGFRAQAAVADLVDLPELVGDDAPLQRRLETVRSWGGWAAAAALLLVWITGVPLNSGSGSNIAGIGLNGPSLAEATPDEALARYIDAGQLAGRVVGEVPDRVVVETLPREDGTIEVVYLRQIVERRITDRVYRETRDESGQLVPVPVPTQQIQRSRAF